MVVPVVPVVPVEVEPEAGLPQQTALSELQIRAVVVVEVESLLPVVAQAAAV
jgi:hypothetical protein